jgi:hypothetical protein
VPRVGCIVVGALSALVLVARGHRFVGVLTLLLAVGLYFITTPAACWWSPGSPGC